MGFVVLSLAVALAAAPGDAPVTITETDYVDAALRDARVRAVLDEATAVARAQRARAGVLANPEAAFEREHLDDGPRQDTWSLSWAPPLDGRHWTQDRAGRAQVAAAERRHEHARLELRSELREAFAAWTLARERAAFAGRLATATDRLARQVEQQAERGEVSTLEGRRLALARVEVRAEAARHAAELAHARGRARAWMPELDARATPEVPALPPVPSDTSLWRRSPHLVALELDVRQAEALAGVASRFWGLPELSYGRQSVHGDGDDLDGPVYGVRWGLPVFDRRQGDRIEARARVAAARARLELDRARAREEFAAALDAYAVLREAAAAADTTATDADRVLASATARYASGESDVTDLLESLRGALAGRLAGLDAYGAALRAHRELELAAGVPLDSTEGDDR